MASSPLLSNPIGWAQNELVGGWRKHFMLFLLYLSVAFILTFLFYRGLRETTTLSYFSQGAMVVFFTIQVGVLFFVGSNAIRRAVLRDFTTDMISSHRLTPMSGHTAVLGYLTGPTTQSMIVAAANLVICTVLAFLAGIGPSSSPLAPTVVLVIALCGCALIYTLTLLVSLATRGKLAIIAIVVVLGILQSTGIIALLPGLDLLIHSFKILSPGLSAAASMNEVATVVSMAFHLAFALLFFLAAARKYLRDDLPAFSPVLAYNLIVLCALMSATGFLLFADDPSSRFTDELRRPDRQIIASLIGLLLVSILPVAYAASESTRWRRRHLCDPLFRERRPLPASIAAVLTTFLCLGVFLLILRNQLSAMLPHSTAYPLIIQLGYVCAAYLLALLTLAGILRFTYSVVPKAVWVLALALILLWALPPFFDLTLDALSQDDLSAARERSVIFTASPIGLWISVCADVQAPRTAGLAVQMMICLAALALGANARRPKTLARPAQPASGSINTAVP